MAYLQEKSIAIAAVLDAARVCEAIRHEISVERFEKDDRSPVTIADFASQAIICRAIGSTFPADSIIAEEDSASLRQPDMAACLHQVTSFVQTVVSDASDEQVLHWIDQGTGTIASRYWTLDPIDGTKGFLRGDQYAIALALVENSDVKLGVLACPALPLEVDKPDQGRGVLFYAIRGQGAYKMPFSGGQPTPIQVAEPSSNKPLRLVEGVEAAHSNHGQQEALARSLGLTAPALRVDSQAKYGLVAEGEATLYLRLPSPKSPNYREKIWDHAAGSLIVEEAGGRVTDMHGKSLDFSAGRELVANQGVIVSNKLLHDTILKAL